MAVNIRRKAPSSGIHAKTRYRSDIDEMERAAKRDAQLM